MGILSYMQLETPPGGYIEDEFLRQLMEEHNLTLVPTIHSGKDVKVFAPKGI